METQQLSALNLTQQTSAQPSTRAATEVSAAGDESAQGSFDEQLNQQIEQVSEPATSHNSQQNQQDTAQAQVATESQPASVEAAPGESIEVVEEGSILPGQQPSAQIDPLEWVDGEAPVAVLNPVQAAGNSLPQVEAGRPVLPPSGNALPPQQVVMNPQSQSLNPHSPQVASAVELSTRQVELQQVTSQVAVTDTLQKSQPQVNASVAQGFADTLLNKPLNTQVQGLPNAGTVAMDEMSLSDLISQTSRLQQVATPTAMSAPQLNPSLVQANPLAATSLSGEFSLSPAGFGQTGLSTMIQASVSSQQWGQQMTDQVAMMIRGGQQMAEIRLNPAHLGPMEIKMAVQDDQASINFIANNAPVRDAIDNAMPRLREMLEQQGLNLADVDVSTQSEQQQQSAEESASQAGPLTAESAEVSAEETQVQNLQVDVESGVNLYA